MATLQLLTAAAVVFAVILLAPAARAFRVDNYTYGLPSFDDTYFDKLSINRSASNIAFGALQITPDSGAQPSMVKRNNRSGRIMLKKPFTLWKHGQGISSSNTSVASFNTTILINIAYFEGQALSGQGIGEGMTFVIAPNLSTPLGSDGQYLGLTNSSTDGNAANRLFAIEFDTSKQHFDPNENHIGIDINSIRSKQTAPLSPLNITLAPINGTNFHKVWIHYDGRNKTLAVFMAQLLDKNETPPMPESPVLMMDDLDLSTIVEEKSYFGFSASTGADTEELNCVLGWNITIEVIDGGGGGWWRWALAGSALAAVVVATAGVWIMWRRRRARKAEDKNMLGALKSLPGMPREFEFGVLKKATGNFDERNRLGEGGYGVVFRGALPAEKAEVAVKKFTREDGIKSKDDFMAELTIINRLRHRHLVKLLGWCHKNRMLLLVYEFMPNGSLDKHIFCGEGQKPISWNLRYKILGGVASSLQYLHHDFDETVIHRDLKPSNIMLDTNFNARLGDFGLARALEQEKTSYAETGAAIHGTPGYIAPECFHTGKATRESDIYSFGIVLLEVACGNRPWAKLGGYNCLGDWVWSLHREGRILDAVDSRLGNDYNDKEAERLLLLGLACLHPMGSERPNAHAIVQFLSGLVPVPSVPHFKPAFVWPAMDPIGLDTIIDLHTTTSITRIASSHFGTD